MRTPAASWVMSILAAIMTSPLGCASQRSGTGPASTQPGGPTTTRPTMPAPSAKAVYEAVIKAADGIEANLPEISRLADKAAEWYVQDGIGIRAAGDPVFCSELVGRSGGMIALEGPQTPASPTWKGIVLYAPRRHTLGDDMIAIRAYRAQGCRVIVFCPKALLAIKKYPLEYDDFVETHGRNGAMFDVRGRKVISVDDIAAITTGWTFTAEFVSACTRRGKMPAMHASWVFHGKERWEKLGATRKFHDEAPKAAIPALQLGKIYLAELRKAMTVVGTQGPQVGQVASMAIAARDAHKGVYALIEGHAMIFEAESLMDAGVFTRLGYWQTPRADVTISPGDMIFGVGYAGMFEEWGKYIPDSRTKGAKLAWTFAGYKAGSTTPSTPAGEPLIDQGFLWGDAVVPVEGYDVPILPVSGVTQVTVYQMVCAEVLAQRPEHGEPKK